MSDVVADLLDLELAWKRTRPGLVRSATRRAYELELIEQDVGSWISSVEDSLRNGRYGPGRIEIAELPKAPGMVRPLAYVRPEDRLVYTALVGAAYPDIFAALAWSQGTRDFAHQLAPVDKQEWIRNRFHGWKLFRRASLVNLDEGFQYVVFTDVVAYYEQVQIALLMSDLKGIGVAQPVTELLSQCLNRWAQVGGRGLPQGLEASDILAKVYLNNIDLALRNRGVVHTRYSDDIRLYAESRVDAQQLLVDLARLLRKRGLTLQSAKSEIARADTARDKLQGVVPILLGVRRRLVDDMPNVFDSDDPYPPLADIDAALADNPDDAPIEVVRQAFQTYFLDASDQDFEKTLFRFLLKRLGAANDEMALPHIIRFLRSQPQETETVLAYVWRLLALPATDDLLADFLESPQGSVYPHQALQILRWVSNFGDVEAPRLLAHARKLSGDTSTPHDLRATCRKIVGNLGDQSDLEQIQADYDAAAGPLEQAQIICCLARMEKQRRNAFLARVEGEGELQRRAVALVRSG
jgi:Reverse transcriptase (RNA-dependent DNA polymerase)